MQQNITSQITQKAFELLEQNSEGIRWTDLKTKIESSNTTFHPKTVNGIVWKLPQKYPDKIYKPEKGIFRLVKYK